MIPSWLCWPIARVIKHVARHAIKHHRRIGHHARRAAGLAASKPAIVGYVCIATIGGGMWGSVLPIPGTAPAPAPSPSEQQPASASHFLPGSPTGIGISPRVPVPEIPIREERPARSVPEPSSLALLLPALLAFAIARGKA